MNTDATYVEIIHLSDLHYGDGHIFTQPLTADGKAPPSAGMPTLADKLIEDLTNPEHEPARPRPSESLNYGSVEGPRFEVPAMQKIVCLSGDFTQKAALAEFKQAELLVKRLQDTSTLRLPTGVEGIFFCPGNHDVNWTTQEESARWHEYANFLTRVSGKVHLAENAAHFGGVHICDAAKTLVLSLNTEMKVLDKDGEKSRGDLSIEQLSWARQALENVAKNVKRDYIKIAMVHHHPVLLPSSAEADRGYDAITNADKLLPMLHDHGFHVVLHGHKHYPHTFREDVRNAFVQTRDHSLFIVAGGTCGSEELPMRRIATQCYNRIRVHWCAKESTVRVQVITRGLVTTKPNGRELLPDQWYWKTLATDDRHHVTRNHAIEVSPAGLLYQPSVGKHSPVNKARQAEYARTHGYFAVAETLPAMLPGQTSEVHLRIVKHKGNNPIHSPSLTAVTWSGGHEWFPSVRITRADDPDFRTVFAYWGGALLQAELEFDNGKRSIAHVYVPMINSQSAVSNIEAAPQTNGTLAPNRRRSVKARNRSTKVNATTKRSTYKNKARSHKLTKQPKSVRK